MKKLLLLAFFGPLFVLGQSAGFNSTFIILSVNGGSNVYYDLQASTDNLDFNNANLGTFNVGTTNLVFKGAEHNVWRCGSANISSTRLYYRIYPQNAPSGSYVSNTVFYNSGFNNGCGGQDQKWLINGSNVNLLNSLSAGTYTIEVYSDASTDNCCGGVIYAGNNGNNYKANFTLSCPTIAAPSVAAGSSTSLCPTESVILSASGSGHQWYKNGTALSGSTSTTLTASESGAYTVISTVNGCSSAASSPMAVDMNTATAITQQPSPSTQSGMSGANLVVNATGTNLQFQWQVSTNSGSTWTDIAAPAGIANFYNPAPSSNSVYRCVVTGTCGTVTSNASGVVTGAPVSTLAAGSCNSTILNNSQVVYSTWQGAGTYKYEVSGGTLSAPVTINKTWNGFQFCDITGALPGSYSVTSSFKPTNYAQFGATSTCSVILGAGVSTTEIVASQCGSTIANPNTVVNCTWKGAGTYRFEVSGGSLGSTVTVDKTWNGFQFNNVTGALPGAYSIAVSFKPTGYANFGNATTCSSITLGTGIPTTAIATAQCGTTIASTNTTVNCTWVGPGTYRFEVSGGSLASSTVTVDKTWNGFQFADVTGALPGTYSVAVSFKPAGQAAFGAATTCNSITLGTAIPTTAISTTQCGTTIASTNTTVNCTWVGPGTYRFVVSGGGLSSAVTVDKTWNGFQFNNVTGALPGTYSVAVSFKPNGQSQFGAASTCNSITLGASVPTTGLVSTQCGNTIPNINTVVNCTWVGPGTYRFVVSGGTLSGSVTLDKTWNGFQFSNITNAGAGAYTVTVYFKPTGYASFGEPTECEMIELGGQGLAQQDPQLHTEVSEGIQAEEPTATVVETLPTTTWTATATSNPFAHSFQIKLNGAEGISSDASFTAQLTDMSGKVYSQATLNKEQFEAESFGEPLAPGMYLMTLCQGEELRVIRVVKR